MNKIFALIFCLFVASSSNANAKELNILVSINPIYSLVKNVAGDKANVSLLLNKNSSPHHYQMAPSDVKKIYDADVIVIVSEEFEMFLSKFLHQKQFKGKLIKLIDIPTLKLLPFRSKHALFEDKEESHEHHDHAHGHEYGEAHEHHHKHSVNVGGQEMDLHFWANPVNAKAIVNYIADEISNLDPEHSPCFHSNAKNAVYKINILDRKIGLLLKKVAGKNFVVYHDGYQYFENHYNLSNVGAIVSNESASFGIKTLENLSKVIKDKNVQCIFVEPFVSPDMTKKIGEFTKVKMSTLDVEWGGSEDGTVPVAPEQVYSNMMLQNADNVYECLKDKD